MYRIAIELDDASSSQPAMLPAYERLAEIRQHFPDFKVTLFLVPWEIRFGKTVPIAHTSEKNWADAFLSAQQDGWMKFALHGLTHMPHEFGEITYETALKKVKAGKEVCERIGLDLLPIFKAPNWSLSAEGKKAVEELGFQVVEDRYYQWNLRDPLPKETEFGDKIIIAHGHIQDGDGCFNGVCETSQKLLSLPTDTTFHFLNEAL